MSEYYKKLFNLITKDKKPITLFTTLVDIKCFAYYIFARFIFNSGTVTPSSVVFTNLHFVAAIILAIVDLLICCGYIHSCIDRNVYNEDNCTEEVQSALETAKSLTELKQGNIVSSGIYSFDYVAKIEPESIKGDEIWCITGDLEEDAKNDDLQKIIHENLKNGVTYKYFVTRVGDAISDKAKYGKQKLLQDHAKYKKRLKFIEVNEELVAPDIDIIIYKANNINDRIGFVCVEIGDDQNTYIYQQINRITLQGICEKLEAYNISKKHSKKFKNVFLTLFQYFHRSISFFARHLSIAYLAVSATGVLALISFTKIVSVRSAMLFLFPTIMEFLITFSLLVAITESNFMYKEALDKTLKNKNILASIINSREMQSAAEDLKKNKLNMLMGQKGLGHVKEILHIDDRCSAIWLLSDLSHDIANRDFYEWLKNCMDLYKNLVCYILFTKGTAARGRMDKIKRLELSYNNRVKVFALDNISAHYIWSKTHGIIFLENINKQPDVYISLGGSNNTFYKKVIATEEEASTLLGRLNNIASIDD